MHLGGERSEVRVQCEDGTSRGTAGRTFRKHVGGSLKGRLGEFPSLLISSWAVLSVILSCTCVSRYCAVDVGMGQW